MCFRKILIWLGIIKINYEPWTHQDELNLKDENYAIEWRRFTKEPCPDITYRYYGIF